MNGLYLHLGMSMSNVWLLSWLWQCLLFGTLLTATTWIVTRVVGKRLPASIHVVLWSAVLIKFLAPLGPLSIVTSEQSQQVAVHVGLPDSAADDRVEIAPARSHSSNPAEATAHATPQSMANATKDWHWIAVGVYVATVLTLATIRIRTYLVFKSRCHTLPPTDGRVCRLVVQTCHRLGIRRIPVAKNSQAPAAPFVIGFLRPILVLSPRHLDSRDILEAVIVHELAHLRFREAVVRAIQRSAATLLFFWPVVGWVNRRIDVSLECMCDEWALRHGRLSACAYARCLLSMVRPAGTTRFAYHPACMAANCHTIERRIDMVLAFPSRSTARNGMRPASATFLLIWGGVALIGAAQGSRAVAKEWPISEEAVMQHASELYGVVAARATADFDGDGVLGYLEKDAYLIGLALESPDAFMAQFPYADRNSSGALDILEAFGAIRGITLIAYADRRLSAAAGARLDLEFYHEALGSQKWLLDNVATEPSSESLDNIVAVLLRTQGRQENDHHRKLDHGGSGSRFTFKRVTRSGARFQELERNIAAINAKLAIVNDAVESAKLKVTLDKLEDLLETLQDS